MIDNINLISPLLNFEEEGDFYMLYIMKRKKDQGDEKDNHQSVRTIKTYCIESNEYLEKRYPEIKDLCEMFKARAYIHIQKQNHNHVSLEMMVTLANRIRNGQHNQKNLFDSVVGQLKTLEKRWVVDVDTNNNEEVLKIIDVINNQCRPFLTRAEIHTHRPDGTIDVTHDYVPKVLKVVPTKNGCHLITERFDVIEFKKHHPEVEIQKKNPTLLYYPDSLD
jgi:hypothetical protein